MELHINQPALERSDAGFALLLVIACVGLLAVAAAVFARLANTHVRTVALQVEAARLEAIADAGISLAVLRLHALRAKHGQVALTSAAYEKQWHCLYGDDYLGIEIEDEAGKVDLNFASERLLRTLLIGLGLETIRASSLADAIADFRDLDDDKRPNGAEKAEYIAAGRQWGPKNSAFVIVEELNQVLGMDADLMERLLPFITVHSGKDGIDPDVAKPRLLELITLGDKPTSFAGMKEEVSVPSSYHGLPGHFVAKGYSNVFTVRSNAVTKAGLSFVREAIVDTSASPGDVGQGYRAWKWRRAGTTLVPAAPASPTIPPC